MEDHHENLVPNIDTARNERTGSSERKESLKCHLEARLEAIYIRLAVGVPGLREDHNQGVFRLQILLKHLKDMSSLKGGRLMGEKYLGID